MVHVITLPNGRQCSVGVYVKAWRALQRMRPSLNPATIPLRKPRKARNRATVLVVESAAYAAAFLLCGAYLVVCAIAHFRKDTE